MLIDERRGVAQFAFEFAFRFRRCARVDKVEREPERQRGDCRAGNEDPIGQ
jgi:hypothetical protein